MGFITDSNETYYEGGTFGGYQFVPLEEIVNNFVLMFTGEGKVLPKVNLTEVRMHCRRAIQEFSYDVFRTYKAQEIEVPPSLTMRLPQDYVNWVKISRIDSQGVERPMHPVRIVSNPSAILQDNDYNYLYDGQGDLLEANNSETWNRSKQKQQGDYNQPNQYDDMDTLTSGSNGGRYGLDPEHANSNNGFFIDDKTGLIHFTGGANGALVSLQYLSDGNGEDGEMVVHKFAEDAVYKYILYSMISVQMNAQEYLVRRYKKSYLGAKRNAKLRLSNLKPQAMLQVLRGKSKQIKH
jgi:hypothetical protein